MKVRIVRAIDDYELSVRYTDEIAEDHAMTDNDFVEMEEELKRMGRFWLDADTFLKPCRD